MARYYGIGVKPQHHGDIEMHLRERRPLLHESVNEEIELNRLDSKVSQDLKGNKYMKKETYQGTLPKTNKGKFGNLKTGTKIAIGAGAITGASVLAGALGDYASREVYSNFYNSPRNDYMVKRGYEKGIWTMQDYEVEKQKDRDTVAKWDRIDAELQQETSKQHEKYELQRLQLDEGHEGWLSQYPHFGPGNKIRDKALNALDEIARTHDIEYGLATTNDDIFRADKKFLDALATFKSPLWYDSGVRLLGRLGIGIKTNIEQTLGKVIYPSNLNEKQGNYSNVCKNK